MSDFCPKVSVVIPVYNVEKYLDKCLETITAQTYRNYELILVDDGSKDSSGSICDRYKQEHPETIVIHQKNMGLSGARNSGVKVSSGKYITFIDSDDFVANNYIEFLMNLIKEFDADVSVCQDRKVWDDSIFSIKNVVSSSEHKCYTAEEALIEMCYTRAFRGYAVAKLYKRELVEQYPYPLGMLYEDIATTHKIIGSAQKIACGSEKMYFYRQGNTSIMRSKFTDKQWDGMRACELQLDYIRNKYPKAEKAAIYKCAARINNYMFMLLEPTVENKHIYKALRGELNKYSKTVLFDDNVKNNFKVRVLAMLSGYYPMSFLYRLVEYLSNKKIKKNA